MRVVAMREGYYLNRRIKKGEIFDIKKAEDFSDVERKKHPGWMKKYSGKKAAIDFDLEDKEVEHDSGKGPSMFEAADIEVSKKQKNRAQDQEVI